MYKSVIENKFMLWLESYELFDVENRLQEELPLRIKARLFPYRRNLQNHYR